MATCSIFDNITINNPKFLEEYVDHMDAADGSYRFVRRTDSNIRILNREEGRKLSELRRKNGETAEVFAKQKSREFLFTV